MVNVLDCSLTKGSTYGITFKGWKSSKNIIIHLKVENIEANVLFLICHDTINSQVEDFKIHKGIWEGELHLTTSMDIKQNKKDNHKDFSYLQEWM